MRSDVPSTISDVPSKISDVPLTIWDVPSGNVSIIPIRSISNGCLPLGRGASAFLGCYFGFVPTRRGYSFQLNLVRSGVQGSVHWMPDLTNDCTRYECSDLGTAAIILPTQFE